MRRDRGGPALGLLPLVVLALVLPWGRPGQGSEMGVAPPLHEPMEQQEERPLSVGAALGPLPAEESDCLPSPGLTHVLLPPRFGDGRSVTRLFDTQTKKLHETPLPGKVWAQAWLDGGSYLQVRETPQGGALEWVDIHTGSSRVLDEVPKAPLMDWAADPGGGAGALRRWSRRLWVGPTGAGASAGVAVVLVVRRSDTLFEIRRYVVAEAQPLTLSKPVVQLAGSDKAVAGDRLWQVVPSLTGHTAALIWRNPARLPALRIDGLAPKPGEDSDGTQLVAEISEELSGCSLAEGNRLICQVRSRNEKGWLLSAEIDGRFPSKLRQLTYAGDAAAYRLSPDGRYLAYVGSGGDDGPLTVEQIATGVRRKLVLQPGECGKAVSRPVVFWPDADHMLVRGYCAAASMRVSAGDEHGSVAPLAAAGSANGPRGTGRPSTAGRMRGNNGAFWSPRF